MKIGILIIILITAASLFLTSCRSDLNAGEADDMLPKIFKTSSSISYINGFDGDKFEITDVEIKRELLEIIDTAKQAQLSENEISGFLSTSFRHSFDFVIDDKIYCFEVQSGGLMIVHDITDDTLEYYSTSEIERVRELNTRINEAIENS